MSIFKKTNSLVKYGMKPVTEGIRNYNHPDPKVEALALSRSEDCAMCENFVDEPIDFMAVEDERIVYLSGKMCDDCACALPYLIRQNIKICKYWKA